MSQIVALSVVVIFVGIVLVILLAPWIFIFMDWYCDRCFKVYERLTGKEIV